MPIKQLLCLTLLTTAFSSLSMELVNYFDTISDLLPTILIQKDHQYPWQNFIRAWKLKSVCKKWCEIIGRTKKLAQTLNIPPMHRAAMMNNPDKIIRLKLAGHSPLAPDIHGIAPMYYAFECRQSDALTILRIGLAAASSTTCCRQGYEKVLDILQTTCTNQYTQENIIQAIKDNDYTRVVTILSDDFNLCTPEVFDYTKSLDFPQLTKLFLYVSRSMIECLLSGKIRKKENISEEFFANFIKYNANPNAYNEAGSTFLHRIVLKKSLQPTLQKFLKLTNIDINLPHLLKRYTAIQSCAAIGNAQALTLLLEAKKLKNEPLSDADDDALNNAAYNNHIDCLNLLIEHGANVNRLDAENGSSPLHYAIDNNRIDSLVSLLKAPKCVINILDHNGSTPLMKAVIHGHAELMSILIAHGANPHLVTRQFKDTLMHIAANMGSTECLKRLLFFSKLRYQINQHDVISGYTPLINATRKQHLPCMNLLALAQADINAVDGWGQTALHFAAAKGFDKGTSLLITHNANINCISGPNYIFKTRDGHYTPLHFAAEYGHSNIVKILIEHGADKNLKTQLDKTPLDLAKENNHQDVVNLLA